jgi:hypothetical protein
VLAYFETSGVFNGGTEAINLIIEKVRRLAHGFKDFDHYRLRIMLAADGRRPYRALPNHAQAEDPVYRMSDNQPPRLPRSHQPTAMPAGQTSTTPRATSRSPMCHGSLFGVQGQHPPPGLGSGVTPRTPAR